MSRVAVTPGKPASLGYRVYILLCPLRFRSALATRGEPRRYTVAACALDRGRRPPAEHGATTHRTRFIHRRWHFAKFYEQDGVIKISPIRGAVNPANVLTKFTFGSVFIKERRYIMGILHD